MSAASPWEREDTRSSVGAFLRSRVFAIAAAGFLLLAGISVWFAWHREQTNATQDLEQDLALAVLEPAAALEVSIEQYRHRTRFLAQLPPIQGLVRATAGGGYDTRGQTSYERWIARLEQIFVGYLETHSDVDQLRYVGVADGGLELVRVERTENGIRTAPPHALQRKGHRDYVQQTLALPPGGVFVSDITLNRERGRIEQPRRPMLRMGTPIYAESGAPFGLIVVNVSMRSTFEELARSAPGDLSMYVLNAKGDFLLHPDPQKAFAFEFGRPFRWNDAFAAGGGTSTAVSTDSGARIHVARTKIALDPDVQHRFIELVASAPQSTLTSSVVRSLFRWGSIQLAASTIAMLLLYFYWASVRSSLRAQAEQTRLAAIVQGSVDAIVGVSLDGRVESWNPAAARVFRLPQSEALGRVFFDLVGPDASTQRQLASLLEELHDSEDGQCRTFEVVLESAEADSIDVSIVLSPVRDPDGGIRGAAAIVRDVTAEKAAHARVLEDHEALERLVARRTAELQEANSVQRSILAQAGYAIIATDRGGTITHFNAAAEAMLGYHVEDVVGHQTLDVFHDPAELRRRAEALSGTLRRPIEAGLESLVCLTRAGAVDERPWTYVRRDGSRVPVRVGISALRSDDLVLIGFLAIAVDQTEVLEREQLLQVARQQAEASSRAKGQFLANMSHEIRTPMNAIAGALDLMGRSPLTREQAQNVDLARTATRTLVGIINDVLDYSKIEAGKLELCPEAFAIDGLLRDLGRMLASTVGDKSLRLLFDVDDDVPSMVVGDSMRLQQVLLNITGNAIKFTQSGRVLVGVRTLERTGDSIALEFRVSDTGVGIPANQIDRIFDSFEQAESSTTRRFGGTGLGLAISRRLVQMMGGSLRVESTEGEGSTFRFDVALVSAGEDASELGTHPRSHMHDLRVLVFDELPAASALVARLLTSFGWSPTQTHEEREALRLLREEAELERPFDVVIFGGALPGKEALRRSRRCRRVTTDSPLTTVVLTTTEGHDALRHADPERHDIDALIVEPVTPSMLFDAVHEARRGRVSTAVVRKTHRRRGIALDGIRILLVEDNPLNQRVAHDLLSAEGAQLRIASSGQEAVDILTEMPEAFDTILMDLQMPELDGLEATAIIRQRLGLTHVPIIAMTANAMREDRDMCIAAGMVDHVGKPFAIDDLVTRILSHTLREAASPFPSKHSSLDPDDGRVNEDVLNSSIEVAVTRLNGNRALWSREARIFVREYHPFEADFRSMLQRDEPATIARALHSLKGAAGTLGADRVGGLAGRLERAVLEGCTPHELEGMSNELIASLQDALKVLSARCVAPHPSDPTDPTASIDPPVPSLPISDEDLDDRLQVLSAQLGDHDLSALDLHSQLEATLTAKVPPLARQLERAIDHLDFAVARDLCHTIRRKIAA